MSGADPSVIDVPETPTSDDSAVIERRVKVQMVPLQAVQEERAASAKAKAEAEALRKQLAELEPDAARWREHSAAELQRMTERNTADLAALPEQARGPIEAITDPIARRALLDAIKAAAGVQAAPAQPAFPAGGATQQVAAGGVELTPAERTWVETVRRDLRDVSPAVVKKHYKNAHPGSP